MARTIVKLNDGTQDWYLEWTTVADGPYSYGMSLEEFKEYYIRNYGESKRQEMEERLARVEQKGTSSMIDESGDDVIRFNRCGRGETILTKQQIIDVYCTQITPEAPMGTRLETDDDDEEDEEK